jgi:RNA polymerase sigma-70 factor (ECF subfamily)
VVVLKHYAGFSNDEISEALDIPEGTVRSRLHYAIQALRAEVEADRRPAIAQVEP